MQSFNRTICNIIIECVKGDIADQPGIDAVVNAANAELQTGAGVAGAIHRAAGPWLYEECRPLAPIGVGQAVITGGHRLTNRLVIHCLGPVYGRDEPADEYLAACYRNALRLAEEHYIRSIAFPAISTGTFGFPMEAAAKVALTTIFNEVPSLSEVKLIRIVLFSEEDAQIHTKVLSSLPAPKCTGKD